MTTPKRDPKRQGTTGATSATGKKDRLHPGAADDADNKGIGGGAVVIGNTGAKPKT